MPTFYSIHAWTTRSVSNKKQDSHLAAAATSRFEAGNFRAAIRLFCSEVKPAPNNAATLEALKSKHPPASPDGKPPCEFFGNSRFQPLQVSPEDVIRCLKTFPAGSSGGPDGFTAQHLRDILSGAPDEKLKAALTGFINILLNGELPVHAKADSNTYCFVAQTKCTCRYWQGEKPIATMW